MASARSGHPWLDASTLGRISSYVLLAAAVLVISLGIYLTVQAVAGNTTF